MAIRREKDSEMKQLIVKEVLMDLPEWFGIESAIDEYVEKSSEYPLWVAREEDTILGFISLKQTAQKVGEIYCMGIKKNWHNQGIGTQLMTELEAYAKEKYEFLQVKTVEEGRYKEYDQTIRFYKSIGFTEFEIFPTLWDEWNPCLVMIKSLGC